jgi:signal transduction histidine kinase
MYSVPTVSGSVARLAVGLALAALVWVAGAVMERQRFGTSDAVSLNRIEDELAARFAESAAVLADLTDPVAAERQLVRDAARDDSAARRLFDALDPLLPAGTDRDAGVTVYGVNGRPLAWSGRVSDIPEERILGPRALFVAPGALGPRLVRVEPVVDTDRTTERIGSVVVEQLLGQASPSPSFSDTFELRSSLAPVSVRARFGDPPAESPYAFVIPASDGQLLVEARVNPADLEVARRRWREVTIGFVLLVLAATLILAAVPIVVRRRLARTFGPFAVPTVVLIVVILSAYLLVRRASPLLFASPGSTLPFDVAAAALALAAVVWLLFGLIERVRLLRLRLVTSSRGRMASIALFVLAGATGTAWIWLYQQLLARLAGQTADGLVRLSFFPPDRLGASFGLILLHAAVIWSAALLFRAAAVMFRVPRTSPLAIAVPWAAGAALALAVLGRWSPVLVGPTLVALSAVGACAAALSLPRPRSRRASQAARLGAFFLALLVPVLAMYPTLHTLAADARERRVAEEFAPQAANLRDDLQERLRGALGAIDALPSLEAFVPEARGGGTPSTDEAFSLWRQTDLATFRVTSAVELYTPDGRLTSRFALNLPGYSAENIHVAAGCDWDLIEEVSPFGSSERHVLRASRAICSRGRRLGSVVVRAMLDYRTLPFIVSESPYLESLGPVRGALTDDSSLRDLEFVVYGWSRAPIQTSGTSVWTLPDPVFDRLVAARDPFWETVARDDTTYRVHFLNDRGGIYALGYPTVTAFGHLVALAELTALSGVMFVVLLGAVSAGAAITPRSDVGGRVLMREIRSSFYRKLFIAFVAAAVVPVIVMALATRAYFAAQFRAEIEEAAIQTAAVAQRLVEDYATLQQTGTDDREVLDDQIMMVVARAIGQAVNLFERETLQATSERDLFASGLLPPRTPADVYRAIVIDRMPMFVGEEAIGGQEYLLAGAPVRAGGRDGIVTVPQTLRRREIEDQIDELDRRVLFASVLFVLIGAAIGYWMAERIADPVNRLTRATRRIARGDLDARVAATSSDELRRLVEDFNHMAADLQRQRAELERTQRLEAWAEMARQVAHDIKNPLTPIQLSAEHARRVNLDKGAPLSPVLDSCVDTILRQVTLLRQISAEFSSFASSPTARPEPTALEALIEDVIAPYRTGLTGRVSIEVDAAKDLPLVPIDRTLFSRALTNIVENALHAMPGGGKLTIRTDYATDRQQVVVTITDTGIGMDAEAKARLFEPYFSTRAAGTGLGLTIAKRNIELLGGTISVGSERGVGTTVTIVLNTQIQPGAE